MTTPASTYSTSKMVATKKKVLSCSTPEHRNESPSRDSDSLCDSEAASPVPFLCTQDGAEGETDVVWNFYTPNSKCATKSRLKNATPLSRKSRKACNFKLIEKPLTRRRVTKPSQKNTELFQDLLELNQNLQELITKNAKSNNITTEKQFSGSDDDIFIDSGENSSRSGLKTNTIWCLRKNLLTSKFTKTENDNALESDDSMNECLIKASQVVEEKILNQNPTPAKRARLEKSNKTLKGVNPSIQFNMDQDSMDAILNSIKLDSPVVHDVKNIASSSLNNDSFDNFVGNLNDSALDRLSQVPVNSKAANRTKFSKSSADWSIQEVVLHESSPISKSFGRHNSMPESPRVTDIVNKPSSSGMVFGRYSSMPHDKNKNLGDSPITCTPDEIRRKHQQAREKLLAKRLLPFTQSTQQTSQSLPSSLQSRVFKKTQFKPQTATSVTGIQTFASINSAKNGLKAATSTVSGKPNTTSVIMDKKEVKENHTVDIKLLIEKKRQEALMKLRKRQHLV